MLVKIHGNEKSQRYPNEWHHFFSASKGGSFIVFGLILDVRFNASHWINPPTWPNI